MNSKFIISAIVVRSAMTKRKTCSLYVSGHENIHTAPQSTVVDWQLRKEGKLSAT